MSNAPAAAGCIVALSPFQSQKGLPLGAELFQEPAPVAGGGARLIALAVGRLERNNWGT